MSRHAIACVLGLLCLLPQWARGQTPSTPPAVSPTEEPRLGVTVLAEPPNVWLSYRGGLRMDGRTPLELPAEATGSFALIVEGEGVSRTHGVFRIPEAGRTPELASESKGFSGSVLVRSLNFPGLPAFGTARANRGATFLFAAAGAGFGAARSHLRYRDRLDEFGPYAGARARDEHRARTSWLRFGGAVWAASAVDHMIRPRLQVQESTPERLHVLVPETKRGSAIWRSMVIPGAGQEFAGHRFRSTFWLGAALAAGAAVVVANVAIDQSQTRANWAETLVDSAGPSERAYYLREAAIQKNNLQESLDARRGSIIALATIWAANVLDAGFMHVSRTPPTPARISATIPISPDGPGIAMQYRF